MERIRILGADHIVIVLTDKLVVAEAHELVVHRGAYNIKCVAEVFRLDGFPGDIKLEPAVAHRTYVDKGRREKIRRNGHIIVA